MFSKSLKSYTIKLETNYNKISRRPTNIFKLNNTNICNIKIKEKIHKVNLKHFWCAL